MLISDFMKLFSDVRQIALRFPPGKTFFLIPGFFGKPDAFFLLFWD